MSVGESILGLLGRRDPRQDLIQSIVGAGQGGAPYAAQPATAPATDAPAASAPATPQALQSPPDLAGMYSELMKYQSRAGNLDRGFGLIGSAISQDGNRESTLRAFTGDTPTPVNPGAIAELAMTLNKTRALQVSRAAQLAALPAIARRYGLDMDTARAMMETGKLDEIIANAEKPDRAATKNAFDQPVALDLKTGQTTSPQGPIKPTLVDGPGGSKYLMDPTTQSITKELIPAGADTEDTKNYNAQFDDWVQRGNSPADFPDMKTWALTSKKAGATSIDQKAESAEQAKIGGYWGDQYTKVQDAGKAANDTIQNYDLIQKGLDSGVTTGALGESELQLRKFGQYLGIADAEDAKKIAGGELIQKISNKMALLMRNPESGMGMPGSLSDKDLSFLRDSQVGLSTSAAGNKLSLEVFKRMENRKVDMAAAADDWVEKNGTMKGFTTYWRDWSKSHPMFDDIKVEDYAPKDPEAQRKAVFDKYGIPQDGR